MRKGLLGSLAILAASAGVAFGQPPRGTQADPAPMAAPPPRVAGSLPPGLEVAPGPGMGEPTLPPGAFGPGGPGGPAGCDFFLERYWTSFEYLLWQSRNGPSAWPVAVSGTVAGGADFNAPGAVILLGGREFDWDAQNGARFVVGGWLPGSTRVGIEATAAILENKPLTRSFASGPEGLPVLGIPFVNELTGGNDGVLVSSPGNPGSIVASAKTQMWYVDLNLVGNVLRTQYMTINLIGGFRNFNLAEGLFVQGNTLVGTAGTTFQGVAVPVGTRTAVEDRFDTTNHFYGGQIGFQYQYRWRALTFDFDNQFAMGVMRRSEDLSGFSQAGGVRIPGGVLVSTTNIGRRTDNDFGVVPQVGLKLGWQMTQTMRLFFGFDFIYASSVVRPGDQVDNVVNPTIVPFRPEFGAPAGTARPTQLFNTTDWWATGVSFGLNLRF